MDIINKIKNAIFGQSGFTSPEQYLATPGNTQKSSGDSMIAIRTQNLANPQNWPNAYYESNAELCKMCSDYDTWACQFCDPIMGELNPHARPYQHYISRNDYDPNDGIKLPHIPNRQASRYTIRNKY